MSFVDLMGNDIWSDADITRKTEAIIRSQFSEDDERILNRKITGLLIGQYNLTESEQEELARFQQIVFLAQSEGNDARNDMALLKAVLPVDQAYKRLQRAEVLPIMEDETVINQTEITNDSMERSEAQFVVDNASEEIMALVLQRNPS
jgi:hypothetical protein